MAKSYTVVLKLGEAIENFQIDLAPQAILSGRVLDEKGEPLKYAQVMVRIASTKDIALELALEDCCRPMGHSAARTENSASPCRPGSFIWKRRACLMRRSAPTAR
jgi:hypothetical protein